MTSNYLNTTAQYLYSTVALRCCTSDGIFFLLWLPPVYHPFQVFLDKGYNINVVLWLQCSIEIPIHPVTCLTTWQVPQSPSRRRDIMFQIFSLLMICVVVEAAICTRVIVIFVLAWQLRTCSRTSETSSFTGFFHPCMVHLVLVVINQLEGIQTWSTCILSL